MNTAKPIPETEVDVFGNLCVVGSESDGRAVGAGKFPGTELPLKVRALSTLPPVRSPAVRIHESGCLGLQL